MFLGLAAEINEFHAKNQNLKSIQSRIARAKRGLPTTGKLPYGRTFDTDKSTWGIDEEKKQNIQWAADQYLNHNKSIVVIAKTLGMNVSNLWKILNHRSGNTWIIEFNPSGLNIDEKVSLEIPPLLLSETIQAIHERAKANKTYTHGEIKHHYLLSRMIFCAECGLTMFGQTNHGNRRYYRHSRNGGNNCKSKFWIRAEDIEEASFLHLFNLFGNVEGMEKAIHRAIPDQSKIVSMQSDLKRLEPKLQSCLKEKENLIKSISKAILTDDEAHNTMQTLREKEALLVADIEQLKGLLVNVPSKAHVERRAKLIQNTIRHAFKGKGGIEKMTFQEKRKLFEKAFAGKDAEGKRLGVYACKAENTDSPVSFTIKGILGEIEGMLPLSRIELEEILGTEGGCKKVCVNGH